MKKIREKAEPMPQIPADMTNRATADELATLMAERTFRWNQMRRTQLSYNAFPKSRHGKDIVSDSEMTPELENEILDAFKWWLLDSIYWYMRECVESMCIGIHLDIDYTDTENVKDVIDRSNNKLNIRLSNYLLLLAHTPALIDISSKERAWEFYIDFVETLYESLRADGFSVTCRDSFDRHLEGTEVVLDGMKERGCVRLTVMWADTEYADKADSLEYESQLDAVRSGVPIDDVLA